MVLRADSGRLFGWVSDGFAVMSHDDYEAWTALPKVIVTSEFGFTHVTAKRDTAEVVSDFVAGSLVALKNDTDTHYKVQYPDGRVAFLVEAGSDSRSIGWLDRAEDTPGNVVATAKRFIGIPYLWGGTSSKGLDAPVSRRLCTT